MAYSDRLALISEIETLRQSKVLCYLTSIRQNAGAQMAEDAVRVFFDHLLLLPERPEKQIDVFLCSNGGSGVVPWRLVSLLREFATRLGVLIPYRAYSAATMLTLGADEIVMHPFGEMGPIDPTVSNDFNPVDQHTHQRVGISVEDVKAYVSFVKDTVGIRHEDELVKAIEILAQKVHPLALGNVERFISQNRLMARKILLTHMSEETNNHQIDETIDTLASKLYFHGHPINRNEAREEMHLKVVENVPPALETAMWKLYLDYEGEFQNDTIFDPISEIFRIAPPPPPASPGQPVTPAIIPPGTAVTLANRLALVESSRLSSAFDIERRFVVVGHGPQFEPVIRTETLAQGWSQQPAPETAPAPST